MLSKRLDCDHIATRKSKRKKIKKTTLSQEVVEIKNTQNFDNEDIDTLQNNILKSLANQDRTESECDLTDLAEILANLIKDDIPPALMLVNKIYAHMVKFPIRPKLVKWMKKVTE